ncbi:MAG: DUF4348 domain-containing protein [Prevotella sp.]|nr:DUF4348 domain-containing protein [Candidatus Prevotella equi]
MSAIFFTTGCMERTSPVVDSIGVDTLMADSVETDSLSDMVDETPMPVAADELFDDFFFNFAASRKVQNDRIIFPLPVDNYGKKKSVSKSGWVRERFFMNQGYYTLIFNSYKQTSLLKDTAVNNVTVERISVSNNKVTRWHFARTKGLWHLDGMRTMTLSQHPDAAFLRFYDKFVSDSVFQQQSLAETVSFTGPDPDDDFSTMTGEIMPEQWPMFAPQLPSGTLYNIVYGTEAYPASSIRLFLIRGIANGLQIDMHFVRQGGSWMLKKINT